MRDVIVYASRLAASALTEDERSIIYLYRQVSTEKREVVRSLLETLSGV